MPDTVSIKQLLEAGAHFGHQTGRWNPRMKNYIFTKRNGIHIIDLEKTAVMLDKACAFVRDLVASGESIVFVGTKKQAQDAIKEEAERCGMPYVNYRWLGGMLTNFSTVTGRVKRMVELRAMQRAGEGGTGSGGRQVGIGLRAAGAAHGVGGAVLLVIGVQDEENVQRASQHRVGNILRFDHLPKHVHEILWVAQVIVGIDVGQP